MWKIGTSTGQSGVCGAVADLEWWRSLFSPKVADCESFWIGIERHILQIGNFVLLLRSFSGEKSVLTTLRHLK